MQLIESEKMSSLGELVAGVSHEVSTPIGICITAQSFFIDETRAIQDKFDNGSMARQDFVGYIDIAFENGQILTANLNRTAELIRNFKQVAVDQCIEDLRSFAVHRYIVDLLTTLKPRIKSLKHTIEVVGDEQLVITSLPGAMAQIITNLIMNSIIHGFEDTVEGHIRISVIQAEHGVRLIYEDDGKGMPEESLEKIFDPFFTTRKGKGGTGLGMNIVYKLITDSLHGSIDCKSENENGVCFNIFISDQEL
jgi:signal transduction histidine kinase